MQKFEIAKQNLELICQENLELENKLGQIIQFLKVIYLLNIINRKMGWWKSKIKLVKMIQTNYKKVNNLKIKLSFLIAAFKHYSNQLHQTSEPILLKKKSGR